MESTCDVIEYMSQLTPFVLILLQYMQGNKIVLGGSRAAGFFNRHLCSPKSDWDFYITDCALLKNTERFIFFLKQLGMMEINTPTEHNIEYELIITGIFKITTMQAPYNGGHTIQIMSHRYHSNIDIIAKYDLSAVQCAITGYCAISMYHPLTSSNKMLWWKDYRMKELQQELEFEEEYMKESYPEINKEKWGSYISIKCLENRINKYIDRGMKLVPHLGSAEYRHIGDSKCLIVDFTHYGLTNDKDKRAYESICWVDNEQNDSNHNRNKHDALF